MGRDHRLNLGRYVSNPFDKRGKQLKKLNFNDLFSSKPEGGQYPWNPARFGTQDLLRRMKTRKATLNPDLKNVGNSPYFKDGSKLAEGHELFEGIGRFNRQEQYDFEEGRPLTSQRPEEQPDFNPTWIQAFKFSPTMNPQNKPQNPNPTFANPDPNGFIQEMAMGSVEGANSDDRSISQLLSSKGGKEEEVSEKDAEEESDMP
jgi:hypothetical protein